MNMIKNHLSFGDESEKLQFKCPIDREPDSSFLYIYESGFPVASVRTRYIRTMAGSIYYKKGRDTFWEKDFEGA